ncbi:septum site-determining protein MinC [Andreprevotia lacus DSM 23236]|jgi:septum site-determining protein MinC|uniref:Probable septum site-determining protein MinC n=1 Tax=Andreprevotia lacus DSM 23236 TaxID=1121001 RepID=A0A1W1XD63_9NEIS|nr:septum site-determining protein MinC [Andreprevotia lacus]SMC21975.1 septum site-determining protein MinC [Andreprevotia lacus DSM 23236]
MSQRFPDPASAFEFRSVGLKLLTFVPATLDPVKLESGLREQLGSGEHMLAGEQLAVDFDSLPELPSAVEVAALVQLLRQYQLKPIAARGGNPDQRAAAREAGLIVLNEDGVIPPVPAAKAAEARVPAMVITRPVRTGQQVYAKGGDLVVLALVSAGAEVIADGNIHVYAPLRGRALAGARGDTSARVYTTCMEAELVSVAGVYRSLDETLPVAIRAKAAQVYLDQDKLVIEALNG